VTIYPMEATTITGHKTLQMLKRRTHLSMHQRQVLGPRENCRTNR